MRLRERKRLKLIVKNKPMTRNKRFLEKAEEEARKSNDNFRIGAILVKGGNIIKTGFNRGWKTHPIQARMYPERVNKGIHAEVDVLQGLRPYDASKGIIYLVRLKKDDSWGLAEPCNECQKYLEKYGIDRVFYSIDNVNYGQIKLGRN